ncbi:hypothetical protein Taro_018217, partial [Colocasia esculenta]|nr:hypothetical protein [Colocasia esculenta]
YCVAFITRRIAVSRPGRDALGRHLNRGLQSQKSLHKYRSLLSSNWSHWNYRLYRCYRWYLYSGWGWNWSYWYCLLWKWWYWYCVAFITRRIAVSRPGRDALGRRLNRCEP